MEKFCCLSLGFLMMIASVYCQTVESVVIVPERTLLLTLEGDQLKLGCVVTFSGNPNVQGTFSKDGQVLTVVNNQGYNVIVTVKPIENDKLRSTTTLIKSITDANDKGEYSCSVPGKSPVTIRVYTFTASAGNADLPVPVYGKDADMVELQCNIDVKADKSAVTYNVSWEHDGKEIVEDDRFTINARNNALQINKPKRSDMGEYQCVITFFPESAVEKHIFRPKPSLLRGGPQIDYYSKSRTVMVGEILELRCEASGFPTPTITWFKNNQEIVADSNISIVEYGNRSSLNITSINEMDGGTYVCRAENHIPPFTASADIDVTVKEKSSDVSSSLSVHRHTSFHPYLLLTMMTFITSLCSSYLCK